MRVSVLLPATTLLILFASCAEDIIDFVDKGMTTILNYDGNGNTSGVAPLSVIGKFDEKVTISGEGSLKKAGYTFGNWNTASDGSGLPYDEGDTFEPVRRTMTVYAQWAKAPVPEPEPEPGGLVLDMILVPASTCCMGLDDSTTETVTISFLMLRTETTDAIWDVVYGWATSHGYTFSHDSASSGSYPAVEISWRDAIVWCNALTEYYNSYEGTSFTCAYCADADYAVPIRTSTDSETINFDVEGSQDCPYIRAGTAGNTDMANCTASGFRLPTFAEWSLAARYIGDANSDGDILDPGEYYPGSWVTGADAAYNVIAVSDYDGDGLISSTDQVAWYSTNSGIAVKPVKQQRPNRLGFYDLCGNAYEVCFDWNPAYENTKRYKAGGGVHFDWSFSRIGYIDGQTWPYEAVYYVGFRFVRTYE